MIGSSYEGGVSVKINQKLTDSASLESSILIDYRERRSKVPQLLKALSVPFQISNLSVDYVIGKNCFVERKTMPDFIASISDGRLFKQVWFLANNCLNPLIILEGEYLNGHISPDSFRGVIIWISLQKKIPVIRTRNENDTAIMLRILAGKFGNIPFTFTRKKALVTNLKPVRRKRKIKSSLLQQIDILTQIPGIGRQTAKDLLISFGSIAKIIQTADSELINCQHIGKERLESIRRIFPITGHDGKIGL